MASAARRSTVPANAGSAATAAQQKVASRRTDVDQSVISDAASGGRRRGLRSFIRRAPLVIESDAGRRGGVPRRSISSITSPDGAEELKAKSATPAQMKGDAVA